MLDYYTRVASTEHVEWHSAGFPDDGTWGVRFFPSRITENFNDLNWIASQILFCRRGEQRDCRERCKIVITGTECLLRKLGPERCNLPSSELCTTCLLG